MKPLGCMQQPRKNNAVRWFCMAVIFSIGLPRVALSQSPPTPDSPLQFPPTVAPSETALPVPTPDQVPLVDKVWSDQTKTQMDQVTEDIKQVTKSDPKTGIAGKEKEKEPESDQKWTVKLGGHVQTDYVLWANADPTIPSPDNYFEFRRLRLVADGVGYGNADFRLQMTLEPETPGETVQIATSPEVKDAYFTLNDLPMLGRLRIGHFFVPFGLEQVTNDTNNIFLERSIPTQGIFTADREVGIAIYNQNSDRRTTWSHGIFIDSISDSLKDRFDDNQGTRLSARYTWLPIASENPTSGPLLHLGAGALHTIDHNQLVRFRARPQIHEGPRLIDSGLIQATDFSTGNLEMAAIWRSFTLQSEAFLTRVDRINNGAVELPGGYVHVSWFLTGENRIYERFGQHGAQFGRNVPTSPLLGKRGKRGPGAWELKLRWSYLDLDRLDRGQYNDISSGFNWYWSDRTRIMFDWIHPWTTKETVVQDAEADILGMRFDFNW